ncbi:MAG: dihydropteridine reductase [Clostridiales bacterium]|nr:dihydropteridine reductase [Clostridiales bacterium]
MNTNKIYAENIINEYSQKTTSKAVALKKLDRKAKNPANIFAYTFGIITCLIFGLGMCLAMKVIGGTSIIYFILGLGLGIIGMVGMGFNYPIYKKMLENGKKKYAFEIIELAKELYNE